MKAFMSKVFELLLLPIMLSDKNYDDKSYDNSRRIQFYKLKTSNIQAIEDAYAKLVKETKDHPDITVRLKRGSDDYPLDKASTYVKDGVTKTNKSTVIDVVENTKAGFNVDSL